MTQFKSHSGIAAVALVAITLSSAQAQQPDASLVAAARKEARVTLYGEAIVPVQRLIKEGFEKKYPGITVDSLYLSGAPMMNRITTEQEAGRYIADVLILGHHALPELQKLGHLARFETPSGKNFDSKWHSQPPGYYIVTHNYPIGIMYNKAAVPADRVPKKLEDLLKPEWAGGKIAIVSPTTNDQLPFYFAGLIRDMGETKAFDFFRALKAQNPLIFGPSGIRVSQGVSTGEFPLGIGFQSHVFTVGGGENGTMAAATTDPVYVSIGPGTAVLRKAPHPSAARLLASFINSEEGQTIYSTYGYLSNYRGMPAPKWLGGKVNMKDLPELKEADAKALREKLVPVFGR